MKTNALIEHLSQFHPKGYDLSLSRISVLLEKLGNPQTKIPPAFHIAGTNGKGSLTANLRAILEAGGFSAHAHTSPHLVNYHERYRIAHDKFSSETASHIASDDMLADALSRVADANDGSKITVFELLAATMFILFSEQPADYSIVEVGLGGRSDCTNVIDKPLATIITPISLDHQSYLGDTLSEIAFEKGGIIKPGRAVIIGPQHDEARTVLEDIALENKCPLMIAGQDFDFYEEAGRFIYQDTDGLLDLPMPALLGEHQMANSATAIAATRLVGCDIADKIYETAMKKLNWPGRFEQLPNGKLTANIDQDTEIWIDGGHNEGAGEVIAREIKKMNSRHTKPLVMISAMLKTKDPERYFSQFRQFQPQVYCVPITSSEHGIDVEHLAQFARTAGLQATACESLESALRQVAGHQREQRLLISGSLYLVGEVLKKNGTPPQ